MNALTHCSFSWPGTYGHECGAPAEFVAEIPCSTTTNRVFFARRCARCRDIKGGENHGVTEWLKFNAEAHQNKFL